MMPQRERWRGRGEIRDIARSLLPIVFETTKCPRGPVLLRIHRGGLPDISWPIALGLSKDMSRTVIERWAAESHSACIPIARCKGSIGFDQHGFALNVGPLTALAIWGIPLEAAKLLAIETASLAGLLSALSLSRFIENHLIDKGAHERLRLMYDGVNAS